MFNRTPHALLCLSLLSVSTTGYALEPWGLCQGWTMPALDYPGATVGDDAAVYLSADSAESLNNEIVKLFGNVLMQRPDEQVIADEAIYYKSNSTLNATGNVRFETADFSAVSDRAHFVSDKHLGEFNQAEFFLYERHARGSSDSILLQGEELTVLKDTSYTTCDKGDEDWALRASTVELDHASGMGDAWNARLHFHGVPVFYFPYILFPITDERMTGLLPPTWGSSEHGGNEFAQPIYLNLHPQLDATITPHNYTERGLKWKSEVRYLSRLGEGVINTEKIDDEVYGQDRSLYHYKHSGKFGSHWTNSILFNRVSDEEYFNDFGTSLTTSSTSYLERNIKLQYDDSIQQLQLQVQDFQLLDQDLAISSQPYRRLPQIKHELSPPMMGPIRFEMESEFVRFQRQSSLTGNRANFHPALSLPYERTAGFIIPKLSLHHTQYRLDEENNTLGETNLRRTVPVNSLDAGIYLERDTQIGQTEYLHTLEPRLFYLYAPYRDQSDVPLFDTSLQQFSSSQLFSENRFSGLDRVGDTNQITVGLSSRLIQADSGKEKLSGTIGKIVYLDDRRVGLNGNILDTSHQSDIVLEAQFKPSDRVNVTGKVLWDTEDDLITERDVRLQYMSDNFHIINLRYRDRGNRITAHDALSQEIDASILWPLSTRWSMMARRYHSLTDDRTLEKMAGFEYNSCCWTFRMVRRASFVEDTEADSAPFGHLRYSTYFQVELKGLTSVGKRIEEFMEEHILGFNAVN